MLNPMSLRRMRHRQLLKVLLILPISIGLALPAPALALRAGLEGRERDIAAGLEETPGEMAVRQAADAMAAKLRLDAFCRVQQQASPLGGIDLHVTHPWHDSIPAMDIHVSSEREGGLIVVLKVPDASKAAVEQFVPYAILQHAARALRNIGMATRRSTGGASKLAGKRWTVEITPQRLMARRRLIELLDPIIARALDNPPQRLAYLFEAALVQGVPLNKALDDDGATNAEILLQTRLREHLSPLRFVGWDSDGGIEIHIDRKNPQLYKNLLENWRYQLVLVTRPESRTVLTEAIPSVVRLTGLPDGRQITPALLPMIALGIAAERSDEAPSGQPQSFFAVQKFLEINGLTDSQIWQIFDERFAQKDRTRSAPEASSATGLEEGERPAEPPHGAAARAASRRRQSRPAPARWPRGAQIFLEDGITIGGSPGVEVHLLDAEPAQAAKVLKILVESQDLVVLRRGSPLLERIASWRPLATPPVVVVLPDGVTEVSRNLEVLAGLAAHARTQPGNIFQAGLEEWTQMTAQDRRDLDTQS